jgi:hypothetical protein
MNAELIRHSPVVCGALVDMTPGWLRRSPVASTPGRQSCTGTRYRERLRPVDPGELMRA